jgi:hypothetical protein
MPDPRPREEARSLEASLPAPCVLWGLGVQVAPSRPQNWGRGKKGDGTATLSCETCLGWKQIVSHVF